MTALEFLQNCVSAAERSFALGYCTWNPARSIKEKREGILLKVAAVEDRRNGKQTAPAERLRSPFQKDEAWRAIGWARIS